MLRCKGVKQSGQNIDKYVSNIEVFHPCRKLVSLILREVLEC